MLTLKDEGVQSIADLATSAAEIKVIDLINGSKIGLSKDGKTFEIAPATKDDHGLDLKAPSHLKTKVILQTADSLVDYTRRFKSEGATLFADIAANRITAALDYHKDGATPAFADHSAVLQLPKSEEWKLWSEAHEKWKGQLEFGRFLQENAADIKAPDAATLLEACQDLRAVRNVNFTKAVRLNSENESFEYVDETKATPTKGAIDLPDKFLLQIPVYFGGRTVEVSAFLRWKLEEDKLQLAIALSRAEHVRQAVFKEVVTDIADRAEVPAVFATI
jgi:uncharacterized protein YfdQ (DUF2303 family)